MSIRFVKAKNKNQIFLLAKLAKEIWEEYYPTIITQEQIHYMIDTFQSPEAIENQIQEGMQYYLAVSGEEEIGYLAYAEENGNTLFLSKIYIKSNFRNKGKGREAFEFIVRQARVQKADRIWLTVNKNNRASIDRYLKMGFVITTSVKNDIGSGFYMDDYVMAYEV